MQASALTLVALLLLFVSETALSIAVVAPPPPLTPEEIAETKQKAQTGDPEAETDLGDWYYDGEHGLRKSLGTAAKWYRKAAAQGNVRAQDKLGEMYEFGEGVPKNHEVALTLIRAATKECSACGMSVASWYESGYRAPKDLSKAIEWLLISAEAGHVVAQAKVAELYENGAGVQDPTEARRWYQAAAAQHWGPAFAGLGRLYENGRGVPQDYGAAADLYRKAIAEGGLSGQYGLARLYAQGLGVAQDEKKAMELYHEVPGVSDARERLLALYQEDMTVPMESAAAIAWYRAAAEQGDLRAVEGLGLRYEFGEGVPQNCGVAYALYNLVARSAPEARRNIPDFTGPRLTAERCMFPATWKLVDALAQPGNLLRAIDQYMQHPPGLTYSD